MSNPDEDDVLDDAEERFKLIELDLPKPDPKPAIAKPVPETTSTHCDCNPPPLAIGGICPQCDKPRRGPRSRRAPVSASSTSQSNGALPTDLQDVAAEARNARRGRRDRAAAPVEMTPAETAAAAAASAAVISAFTSNDIVAGAAAEGHGAYLGWEGKGDLTHRMIIAALKKAGLPDDWTPSPRTLRAQLGRACATINSTTVKVVADRTLSKKEEIHRGQRVVARWVVGKVAFGSGVGESMGNVLLTVRITEDNVLHTSGDRGLAKKVRDSFNELVADEVYVAGDVTGWMRSILRDKLGCVRVGAGMWYAPRESRALAEQFTQAVSTTEFGKLWMGSIDVPAVPVATSDQLRAGLAAGLVDEARDVLADFEGARKIARDAGRADLGARGAATYQRRLANVAERAVHYGVLLGAKHIESVRVRINEALAEVESLVDVTSARGEAIWDEIAREQERGSAS